MTSPPLHFTSNGADHDAPYDAAAVRAALCAGRGSTATMWHDVRVVEQTGSTSSDLAELARAGALEGTVIIADHQVTGRGRLDRSWHTPPGTGIAASMLFRPTGAPVSRWPWLSLLVGVAVVRAVGESSGLAAVLKWPNDVMVGGRKVAGILAEALPAGDAALLVGVGLNVSVAAADLPPTATSLTLAGGGDVDRLGVLAALLAAVSETYDGWRRSGWDAEWARARYRPLCSTLDASVMITVPAGEVRGLAVDIDSDGRLVVRTGSTDVAVSVGDVVHVRRGPGE